MEPITPIPPHRCHSPGDFCLFAASAYFWGSRLRCSPSSPAVRFDSHHDTTVLPPSIPAHTVPHRGLTLGLWWDGQVGDRLFEANEELKVHLRRLVIICAVAAVAQFAHDTALAVANECGEVFEVCPPPPTDEGHACLLSACRQLCHVVMGVCKLMHVVVWEFSHHVPEETLASLAPSVSVSVSVSLSLSLYIYIYIYIFLSLSVSVSVSVPVSLSQVPCTPCISTLPYELGAVGIYINTAMVIMVWSAVVE